MPPEKLPDPLPLEDPRAGHGSVRLSAGLLHDPFGTGFGLNWRPALHDILGSSAGFTGDLEIRFIDLHLKIFEQGLQVSRLGLLDIVSLNAIRPNLTPFSWRLGLLMEEDESAQAERTMRKYVRYALGLAYHPVKSILVYWMPLIDLGHSRARDQGFHLGAGVQTGLLWALLPNLRLGAILVGERRWGRTSVDDVQLLLSGSSNLSRDSEIRIENFWGDLGYRFQLSYAHYFWSFG
jgi:hypothetical protein